MPEAHAMHSNELSSFEFQQELCSKFIDSLCIRLKLTSNRLPFGHLLITGPSFSGKTMLMQLIAKRLFDEMRVFSLHIDCNEFKGIFVCFLRDNTFIV